MSQTEFDPLLIDKTYSEMNTMSRRRELIAIGNYTLHQRCLGKGTFASVELSQHNVLKKDVALKVIDKNNIKDEYVAKNFQKEAQILAQVWHPNIVKLLEVVQSRDFFCVALELCPDGSLLDLLNQHGKLANVHAKRITRQMVAGLVYLHEKNIIHR